MDELLDETNEIIDLAIEPKVKHGQRMTLLAIFSLFLIIAPLVLMSMDLLPETDLVMGLVVLASPLLTVVITIITTLPVIKNSPRQFQESKLILYAIVPCVIYIALMALVLFVLLFDKESLDKEDPLFIAAFTLLGGILSSIIYIFLKAKKNAALGESRKKVILFGILFIISQFVGIVFLMAATE